MGIEKINQRAWRVSLLNAFLPTVLVECEGRAGWCKANFKLLGNVKVTHASSLPRRTFSAAALK